MHGTIGIVVLSVLHVVGGILALVGGVNLLNLPFGSQVIQTLSAVDFAIGALLFVCAYGIWTLQAWGRRLGLVLWSLSLLLSLGLSATGIIVPLTADFVSMAVSAGVIVYLLLPKVKRLFS